jgi:hypothetical protein
MNFKQCRGRACPCPNFTKRCFDQQVGQVSGQPQGLPLHFLNTHDINVLYQSMLMRI